MDKLIQRLFDGLVSVDRDGVHKTLELTAEQRGIEVLGDILMEAMVKVGEGWEDGSLSLAQVYMSGVICEELLKAILPEADLTDPALPVVGTAVYKDHHGLGMRIVSSLLGTRKYRVIHLGTGINDDKIIRGIHENKIQILLVSVLMYPSALGLKELTDRMALECPGVPVVAGGAPFRLDGELYKRVGAGRSAGSAGEVFGILDNLTKELEMRRGQL